MGPFYMGYWAGLASGVVVTAFVVFVFSAYT